MRIRFSLSTVLLSAFLVLGLAACSEEADDETRAAPDVEVAASPEPAPQPETMQPAAEAEEEAAPAPEAATAGPAGEVNIYSYRQPFLIEPLLAAFTEETGIETNVVFADKGLNERVLAEGANSPVDVVLTVDITRLQNGEDLGITQPVSSAALEENIPPAYRDEEGHWFGLTRRARVAYVSKERVDAEALTYEELAEPEWRGRVCSRSGQHRYNLALIASMIAHHGADETEAWLSGLKDNLARKPTGNDRAQVRAVWAGECDVAIGNTYYMGKMQTNDDEPEQQEWAEAVRIVFPNTEDRGTHVNISGMFMAKNAPHPAAALALMEFLASEEAQRLYAEENFEYPVKEGIAWSDRVRSWGTFKADPIALTEIAAHASEASAMVDRVGFDE